MRRALAKPLLILGYLLAVKIGMDFFCGCIFAVEGKTPIKTLNFVHLMPGSTAAWLVRPEKDLSVRKFNRHLRVRTVRDVCPTIQG